MWLSPLSSFLSVTWYNALIPISVTPFWKHEEEIHVLRMVEWKDQRILGPSGFLVQLYWIKLPFWRGGGRKQTLSASASVLGLLLSVENGNSNAWSIQPLVQFWPLNIFCHLPCFLSSLVSELNAEDPTDDIKEMPMDFRTIIQKRQESLNHTEEVICQTSDHEPALHCYCVKPLRFGGHLVV